MVKSCIIVQRKVTHMKGIKSLRTHIIECLERENKECKKIMLKNKKALKDPKTEEFIVFAEYRMDVVEPPYSWNGRGVTLEEAFTNVHEVWEEAQKDKLHNPVFYYKVEVTLRGGARLEVPHTYWKKYEWKDK